MEIKHGAFMQFLCQQVHENIQICKFTCQSLPPPPPKQNLQMDYNYSRKKKQEHTKKEHASSSCMHSLSDSGSLLSVVCLGRGSLCSTLFLFWSVAKQGQLVVRQVQLVHPVSCPVACRGEVLDPVV